MPVVNKTAAPASRNVDISGYGSRLKAGTTPSYRAAILAYFLIRISNSQFRHCKRSEAIHFAEQRKNGLLRYARNDLSN
jgi:hypothetical protein